jgi:hypothetical protein
MHGPANALALRHRRLERFYAQSGPFASFLILPALEPMSHLRQPRAVDSPGSCSGVVLALRTSVEKDGPRMPPARQ